jgi:PAS domain S-box-containing protein
VAVVGGEGGARGELLHLLESCGFERPIGAEVVSELTAPPDVLVVAGGDDTHAVIAHVREHPLWAGVPIVAIAPAVPPGAAAALLGAGADEVVLAPPQPAVLSARLRLLHRARGSERRVRELERAHEAMRAIHSLIAAGGDSPEALREVMLASSAILGFERGALIAHVESSERAYVVAATDDPSYSQFLLMIASYPELAAAIKTAEPLLIADAYEHPLMADVRDALRRRQVRSIAVFPCVWRRRGLGALLFRKSEPGTAHLTEASMDFAAFLAGQVAATLRDSHVIERLTEDTRRISRASYEAERRLRTIESLKEHFEASADGVAVLDDGGRILFVNGAAESITGFARDGLVGSQLVDLVPDEQRAPLQEVIRSVLGGTNLEAFDLDLSTTSGEPICVSVTTSTVLAKSAAVILSFRDVTAERALESELQQTKDFLQRLIDSAVDAIVAADMHGRVLLFNPGAERVFGYTAREILGRLPVWRLYPDGMARQIMQMLRAPANGGVGRLAQTRLEVMTKQGEVVPVNMTASIIYENGREAATVGIVSDLRERLQMEDRLLHIQEQLEIQERQAMVAQLAGAAAHELNQPLTSILGYAQLMERQSAPDAPHARGLQIILREAARMADIVRKIGRITRLEVKEYVGSASIIDLDRSAASSSENRIVTEDGEHTGETTHIEHHARVELDGLVEPAEEEITAQHLILARASGSDDDEDHSDADDLPSLATEDDVAPNTKVYRISGATPAQKESAGTDAAKPADAPAPAGKGR